MIVGYISIESVNGASFRAISCLLTAGVMKFQSTISFVWFEIFSEMQESKQPLRDIFMVVLPCHASGNVYLSRYLSVYHLCRWIRDRRELFRYYL